MVFVGNFPALNARHRSRTASSMERFGFQPSFSAIFFDETPKDEICRRFGVEREYLRVLLHRAKQHFRERYTGNAAPANGHGGTTRAHTR